MGIYFTGKINNGVINNPITKYVSNAEIYDQGTSYGLRICTRYLSSVNIETLQENIKVDVTSDGIYPENVTTLLSKLSESQLLMTQALNKTVENAENLKNHYNLFKTSKTNVPYIQNINGESYWFVNGKNTDVKVIDESQINIEVNPILNNELNDVTIEQCLKKGGTVAETPEYKYLDFNQLNNFAKSINSEFLQKNQGVTKEELNTKNYANLDYLNTNFTKLFSYIGSDKTAMLDLFQYNDAEILISPSSPNSINIRLFYNKTTIPTNSLIIYTSLNDNIFEFINEGALMNKMIINNSTTPFTLNIKSFMKNNKLHVFISVKNVYNKLN